MTTVNGTARNLSESLMMCMFILNGGMVFHDPHANRAATGGPKADGGRNVVELCNREQIDFRQKFRLIL